MCRSSRVGWANFLSWLSRLPKSAKPILLWLAEELPNQPNLISSNDMADLVDWRTPLLRYLRDPSAKVDKGIRQSAFKYMLHNDELYRRTTEDLLLKCLGPDQARVRNSQPRRWSGYCIELVFIGLQWWLVIFVTQGLRRCQRFKNIEFVPATMLYPIIKPWPFVVGG
jgi:hypothetical protein